MNSICCYQRRLKNSNWWITNCSWPGTYTHTPPSHTHLPASGRHGEGSKASETSCDTLRCWAWAFVVCRNLDELAITRRLINDVGCAWREVSQAIEFLYFGQSSWCSDVMSTPWGGGAGGEGSWRVQSQLKWMCGHSDGWQYFVLIRRRSTSKICGQDVTPGAVGEAVQVQVVAAALAICGLMFPNVVYHPFH